MRTVKVGCIILARYNSRRLPGKALTLFDDKPLLKHVYDSLASVFAPDQLVVATSVESTDDAIESFCLEHQIDCYRGDLNNVAQRFINAGQQFGFDYCMRINGDNFFVELATVKKMLDDVDQSIDFYSNVPERTFPYGMSVEMVKTDFFLKLMPAINQSEKYREHVTLYLYEHPDSGSRKYYINNEAPEASGIHLSVDTPEDAKLIQRMIMNLSRPVYEHDLSSIVKMYHKIKEHE